VIHRNIKPYLLRTEVWFYLLQPHNFFADWGQMVFSHWLYVGDFLTPPGCTCPVSPLICPFSNPFGHRLSCFEFFHYNGPPCVSHQGLFLRLAAYFPPCKDLPPLSFLGTSLGFFFDPPCIDSIPPREV